MEFMWISDDAVECKYGGKCPRSLILQLMCWNEQQFYCVDCVNDFCFSIIGSLFIGIFMFWFWLLFVNTHLVLYISKQEHQHFANERDFFWDLFPEYLRKMVARVKIVCVYLIALKEEWWRYRTRKRGRNDRETSIRHFVLLLLDLKFQFFGHIIKHFNIHRVKLECNILWIWIIFDFMQYNF